MSVPAYFSNLPQSAQNSLTSAAATGFNPMMMGAQMGGMMGSAMAPWNNPSEAANKRLGQMGQTLSPYYTPYMNYGAEAFQHPGQGINDIGANYHQSPGFQFALQQALQAGQHSANAGGMAGSPQNQQQQMGIATGLANQDYNNYLQNALSLQQGAGGIGSNMANQMGSMMGQNLTNMGAYDYEGANAQNQHGSGMGGLGGALGGAAGMYFGGPLGSMAGSALGSELMNRVFS